MVIYFSLTTLVTPFINVLCLDGRYSTTEEFTTKIAVQKVNRLYSIKVLISRIAAL